jgi:NAD(P)-dependent dehydrogenase (short-subunit alcohol dehydrogenase family)
MEASNRYYFAGKRVIVTGASSGVGRATAMWLLNHGARVALVGRDIEELNTIGRQFPEQAIAIECDLADDKNQYDMVLSVVEHFGGLDLLVNAAGVLFENDLETSFPQDHDYIMDINLRSVYHITQLCSSFLVKNQGVIVNLSCEWGSRPQQGMISYCMAKAGLEMLTKCLALDLAPVRVNAVAPGVTDTNIFGYAGLSRSETEVIKENIMKRNPMQRLAIPDEVVKAVIFLLSPLSSHITGTILPVDGGSSLTSSLYVPWEKTTVMNSKLVPTGIQFSHWVRKLWDKGVEYFRGPPPRDVNWLRREQAKSNWATHTADAHIYAEVDYNLLDSERNVLSHLEERKQEGGMIYTPENPKAARLMANPAPAILNAPKTPQRRP